MIKATLYHDFLYDSEKLFVWNKREDGTVDEFNELLVTNHKHPGREKRPLIEGDQAKAFMQAICDAAFEAGIYPTKLHDRAEELKAVRFHLEDMRKLVFKPSGDA
jgi:hypothetical protein